MRELTFEEEQAKAVGREEIMCPQVLNEFGDGLLVRNGQRLAYQRGILMRVAKQRGDRKLKQKAGLEIL